MKAGILYPRSNAHPGISMEFMEGIKIYLNQCDLLNEIHFYAENAGFGGVEKEVKEKIEKLIIADEVDVLVAYIDQKILQLLKPMLRAWGKLVIAVSPGADYPQTWAAEPNIIHLNLQHAFLCWLSGALAAKGKEAKAAMVTSFYDCGYLHSTLMVNHFTAMGGSIRFNYVNKQQYNETFYINELTDYLSKEKDTDKLLCILDSLPASLFYRHLNRFSLAGNLQLYVSPMMLETKALENAGNGFSFSIEGYTSWSHRINNIANKKFIEIFSQLNNKIPSLFSLQGWETGMILKQVFESSNGNYKDGNELVRQLKSLPIEGPRGMMVLDSATNYFIAPVLKCLLEKENPELKKEWIQEVEKDWNQFIANPVTGMVSGWTNTYLCY